MITLLYTEREIHPLPACVILSVVPTRPVALILLLSFPCLHQLTLVLGSHSCSQALGQLCTLATLPRGDWRTNTTSLWDLHPVHCGQAAPHGPPIPHDAPSLQHTIPPRQSSEHSPLLPLNMYPSRSPKLSMPSHMRRRRSSLLHKDFLDQAVPARSFSAHCSPAHLVPPHLGQCKRPQEISSG